MILVHVETYKKHRVEIWKEEDRKHNLYRAKVNGRTMSLVNSKENILLTHVKEWIDYQENGTGGRE